MDSVEKIMCFDGANRGMDAATLLSMNNGMNGNNWFIWLFLLLMEGRFGKDSPQLASIQSQMQDNQNANLLMSGLKDNQAATQQLATNLNCDFNQISGALCDIKNAISQVGGQIGFSSEKIINAVLMGNNQLTSAIQSCCCQTQQSIMKMGYENQLAICGQTNTLANAIHSEGEATRALIRQNQFDTLLAEKNRLQTVLDLRDQQGTFAGMIQASIAPVQAGLNQVSRQVEYVQAHQLPTYPQTYIPGTPYVGAQSTGFWG